MRRLDARERKLAAVFLLLLGIAILWLGIVRPIVNGFVDRAERRRELQQQYARDERLIGQLASIGRAAAAQRHSAPRFRLAAADATAATAALTDRLTRAMAASGGQTRGAEDIAATTPGIVRVRLQAGVTMKQLADFLVRIGNGAPLLTVDAMRIDANKDRGEQAPASDLLDVSIDVSAAYSPAAPR